MLDLRRQEITVVTVALRAQQLLPNGWTLLITMTGRAILLVGALSPTLLRVRPLLVDKRLVRLRAVEGRWKSLLALPLAAPDIPPKHIPRQEVLDRMEKEFGPTTLEGTPPTALLKDPLWPLGKVLLLFLLRDNGLGRYLEGIPSLLPKGVTLPVPFTSLLKLPTIEAYPFYAISLPEITFTCETA